MMAFEEYDIKVGRADRIVMDGVSLHKSGNMFLGRNIFLNHFSTNAAVILFFDKESRQIGIKPIAEKTHTSYKLSRMGESHLRYPQFIACRGFSCFYDLCPPRFIRCPAHWSDELGMLIVQLPARESDEEGIA